MGLLLGLLLLAKASVLLVEATGLLSVCACSVLTIHLLRVTAVLPILSILWEAAIALVGLPGHEGRSTGDKGGRTRLEAGSTRVEGRRLSLGPVQVDALSLSGELFLPGIRSLVCHRE